MPKKKKEIATKQIFLPPSIHLRLKVLAASSGMTMGKLIKKLLDRVEPGSSYTVEDDLKMLNFLEQAAAEKEAEAKTRVGKLEIKEATK